LQAGGHRLDPGALHQQKPLLTRGFVASGGVLGTVLWWPNRWLWWPYGQSHRSTPRRRSTQPGAHCA